MASRRSRGFFPWADRWKAAAVRLGGTRAAPQKVIGNNSFSMGFLVSTKY